LRVLFFVEGYTDIRFVAGLSRVCELSIAVPMEKFVESRLKERLQKSKCRVSIQEIPGGRLKYQFRSFLYLWKNARNFDVILAQEVLRGALNATLVGKLRKVPVVTHMGISPADYFRCRRERGQIGWFKAWLGERVIKTLMTINGRLTTRCLAFGPYLVDVYRPYCPRTENTLYYGVDVDDFRPAAQAEQRSLRKSLSLPEDRFLVFFSSRMSHEKDPETVLAACAMARKRGLNLACLNLGGGYQDFLNLAEKMKLDDYQDWIIARPAVHPMHGVSAYFRAADVSVLASLAEGAAYSTLEALASGTPVVATAVGGMAVQLPGYARLVPRRDAKAMCEEFLWIAANRDAARAQALKGREYVIREWNSEKAFNDLQRSLEEASLSCVSSLPENKA
jgi:glycosyltransferase involved in cell wall biosynthesis